MTGNTSKWRAPLAGLASIAMLATMGVAASTANAATLVAGGLEVKAYASYDPVTAFKTIANSKSYGDIVAVDNSADPLPFKADHRVFTGYSYDLAGQNKVEDGNFAIKGDTKLYAQYADAKVVTFHYADGRTKQLEVPTGESITAAEYKKYTYGDDSATGKVFAGWKLTNDADVNDLYTNQAVTSDIDLYPVFETYTSPNDEENVSVVVFHKSDTATTGDQTLYTSADAPFPAYRVPSFSGVEQWSASNDNSSAYDFTKAIANDNADFGKADLTLYGFGDFGKNNWQVTYDFGSSKSTFSTDAKSAPGVQVNVAEGSAIAEPNDPALWEAQFTGWYTADNKKVDFSTPVENLYGADASTRTVTVHAGWDTANIKKVTYNYGYYYTTWDQPTTGVSGKFAAKTGVAYDFVTGGSAIAAPTGVEDYFKTTADKDHGTYTSRTVSRWLAVSDDAPISVVKADTAVYAQWTGAQSVLLNANGGTFAENSNKYIYVTKTDSQKWADVVVTPTRSGYDFDGWYVATDWARSANLNDGKIYFAGTDKATGSVLGKDVTSLVAKWTPSEQNDNAAALSTYPLSGAVAPDYVPSFDNKKVDYALYAKYAKSEEGWKSYVDYVYSLKDEYQTYRTLKGQARIDAGNKLAAKLAAAQEKLTDFVNPKGEVTVFRLFNPNETRAGSHFYTASVVEYNSLVRKGWNAEGVAFVTSEDGDPVYRAYNPNDGSHFYTLSKVEFDHAVKAGWKDEGIAFRVSDGSKVALYRIYNPNSGEHFYTTSKAEVNKDVKAGWKDEGIAWNVIK